MVVPVVESRDEAEGPLGIALLGSTGSIGRQTLEVVERHPERLRIVSLAAGGNVELLATQIARHRPELIALDHGATAPGWYDGAIGFGVDGLIAAVTLPSVDVVVVATSGHAAILPTARAIEAGKTIALANKESIVCAGELITALAIEHKVEIRPVDSEHSAIWQSLGRSNGRDIERLTLTASGGPFRETPASELAAVTVDQALNHPTWVMGGKITIDSATLMNKGLELIEAHWLFDIGYERIEIVVHPESIVHSLVEFVDGSQVAQLSHPDMRLPIQYALSYPQHAPSEFRRLSLPEIGSLRFYEPDLVRFPCLRLARESGVAGKTFPTVLSVADEFAVDAFSAGKLRFTEIATVVEQTLASHEAWDVTDFDAIEAAARWARAKTRELIEQR
jgi:1-deoxy-D-xylulose-5-phosphate reductoisomerase